MILHDTSDNTSSLLGWTVRVLLFDRFLGCEGVSRPQYGVGHLGQLEQYAVRYSRSPHVLHAPGCCPGVPNSPALASKTAGDKPKQVVTIQVASHQKQFDRGANPTFRIHIMSIPVECDESYLGQKFSISRLLHVAKMKLQGATFGKRFVWVPGGDNHRSAETRIPQGCSALE